MKTMKQVILIAFFSFLSFFLTGCTTPFPDPCNLAIVYGSHANNSLPNTEKAQNIPEGLRKFRNSQRKLFLY